MARDDHTISGAAAFANAMQADNARWDHARFEVAPLELALKAKFQLNPHDRFFCVGSCFAREIEEALICRGVEVLSKRIISPKEEYAARPNGIVNKFTTVSIGNELRWALLRDGSGQASIVETGDGWRDLQLVPNSVAVSRERAEQRRRYMEEDYFTRIRGADVLIVTLGLIETWCDNSTGIWQNSAPPFYLVRREPERFSFALTTVKQNIEALEEMRFILKQVRPEVRIVVTVSPVPLEATFSGEDVVTANTRSKSVLRAAAWEFAAAHDDVDYFPSFEMVMSSPRETFAPDCIHVRASVVRRIVESFARCYMPTLPEAPSDYVETLYLRANPDVLDQIRAGELASGFEHWLARGRSEGRRLTPDEIPERLYWVGAVDRP